MVFRLKISYRGASYAGWQRQSNATTVQQVVEQALSELLALPVHIVGASRTDAGVHARGQVAHLELPTSFPARGLVHGANQRLPEDIRVMAAVRMAEAFHARKHAAFKLYCYRFVQGPVLSPLDALFAVHLFGEVDLAAMRRAAEHLVGEHDFTAFALSGGSHTQPVRRIDEADWQRSSSGMLEFRVIGNGFLRGMVRSIVGTLLEVGRGQRSVDDIPRLLEGRPRSEAGPTAPAQGLTLERVGYPPEWQSIPERESP
jgi:tRNA pseudouridine38-40 synthase